MKAPRELPILFSIPMVRAILEERKTVTRRLVKLPGGCDSWPTRARKPEQICPYGGPGDRLWVRETWRPSLQRADAYDYAASAEWPRSGPRWRPSIHMPRRASRITLEVLSVRIERLQQITDEDVFAEGLEMNAAGSFYAEVGDELAEFEEPRDAFAALWDGINSHRARWDSDPWVWRVEFRRVASTEACHG